MFYNLRILKQKIVLIRKKRECYNCGKTHEKSKMLFNTIVLDGEILNTYKCLKCNFKTPTP